MNCKKYDEVMKLYNDYIVIQNGIKSKKNKEEIDWIRIRKLSNMMNDLDWFIESRTICENCVGEEYIEDCEMVV